MHKMKRRYLREFVKLLLVGYLVFLIAILLGEADMEAFAHWEFHAAFAAVAALAALDSFRRFPSTPDH